MTGLRYARVMGMIVNTPLNADPVAAMVLYNALCGRLGVPEGDVPDSPHATVIQARQLHQPSVDASRFEGKMVKPEDDHWASVEPFRVTKQGTGIVSITGELKNRGMHIGENSGVTSYEGIKHQITRIAKSSKAKALVLDIESPGGSAMGMSEVAALVRGVAAVKPVYAVVNGMAASAAYGIASGAKRILIPPSGIAGSIGTIMIHLDMSQKLAKEGIKPTLIYAGSQKPLGNPTEPLSEEAEAKLHGVVNSYYHDFLQTVAAGRGRRLSTKSARETEARTYIGQDAVAAGLADGVATFEEVVAESDARLARAAKVTKRSSTMPENILGDEMVSAADHQRAVTEAREQARREVTATIEGTVAQAVGAERERISAIVAHEGVKGHELYALKMALKFPGSKSEDIVEMMAGLPAAAVTVPPLAQRAAETGVNNVTASNGLPESAVHADGQPKVDWGKALKAGVHPDRLRT